MDSVDSMDALDPKDSTDPQCSMSSLDSMDSTGSMDSLGLTDPTMHLFDTNSVNAFARFNGSKNIQSIQVNRLIWTTLTTPHGSSLVFYDTNCFSNELQFAIHQIGFLDLQFIR